MLAWLTELRAGRLPSPRLLNRLALALFAAEIGLCALVTLATHGAFGPMRQPASTDFLSFYAAGRIADFGAPALVYDDAVHLATERQIFGDQNLPEYYFFYPPVYLPLCQALAHMPYLAAFFVFVSATAALFIAALWGVVRKTRPLLLLMTLPALYHAAGLGQNSFLTGAIFGGAALALDRAPLLGGGLLALLAYKPHLLPLVPVALIAGRRWRALAAFAAVLALILLASLALYGGETWRAYQAQTAQAWAVFAQGAIPFDGLVTSFGAARLIGGGVAMALAAQLAASLLAIAGVACVWRSEKAPRGARVAALIAGALTAAPILLDYDLAPLAVALAWLLADERRSAPLPWRGVVIALVWIVAAIGVPTAAYLRLPLGWLAAPAVLWLSYGQTRGKPSAQPPAILC